MKKFILGVGTIGLLATVLYATTTTNMGLDLPVVGVTTGPGWATKINAALQVIDAHTHAPGSGVQISNAGISSTAAIARSKLATGGGSLVLINDTTGAMSSESTLAVTRGGTNLSGYSTGDILYASSPTGLAKLAIGSSNQLLKVSSGLPAWATVSPTAAPTIQKFTSGTAQTYTLPTFPSPVYIVVELVGGGAGGAAVATNAGGNATASTWSCLTLSAGGGFGGSAGASAGGVGGTASLGTGTGIAISGSSGGSGFGNTDAGNQPHGGTGGASYFGGAGTGGVNGNGGTNATTNSGSGGGGGGGTSSQAGGPGGGAGAYVRALISAPAATCTYTVGAAGSGGSAGTQAGGNGAAGLILVTEYY